MRDEARQKAEISELVVLSLDKAITQEQLARLNELIVNESGALDYYLECLSVQLGMQNFVISNFENSQKSEDQSILQEAVKLDMYETAIRELIVEAEAAEKALRDKLERQRKLLSVKKEIAPKKSGWRLAFKVAAVFMIAGGIFLLDHLSKPQPKPIPVAVAHLTSSIDAQWADASRSYLEGDKLYSGPLRLVNGFVHITFEKGANMVVEAPATLAINSATEIFLEEGQIAVTIQDSEDSFIVQTPRATITDFGTEFGVNVDRNGTTESCVFEGKIELKNRTDVNRLDNTLEKKMMLYTGHAAVVNTTGSIRKREIPSYTYVREREYRVKLKASRGSAYHRWLAYTYQLQQDPGLVAYYTFEKDLMNPDILHNSAKTSRGQLDGALGGEGKNPATLPTWSEGRWPQKGALQFEAAKGQFVRLPSDPRLAITGDLTTVWWMKPNPRTIPYTAVILGYGGKAKFDNFYYSHGLESDRYRAFHEQGPEVSGDNSKNDIEVLTDTSVRFHQWTQVAIVRDATAQLYHFYLNGEWIESHSYDRNCDKNTPGTIERFPAIGRAGGLRGEFYQGLLDEMAIFNRVLTPEEIREYYQAGKIS